GGYDTLLAGHEGIALFSKLFRFYGPETFLNDPFAVLYHDYAENELLLEEKVRKYQFNSAYLAYAYPAAEPLKAALHVHRKGIGARILLAGLRRTMDKYMPEQSLDQVGISVLTVAKDVEPLLEDYTRALKDQTFANFEVVFVDQGSTDGTRERLAELWKHDHRLRLLQSASGRAGALNLAVAEAANDICVIAEAGDVSLPRRLELTARHFLAASSACLSFAAYSEQELLRGATWPVGVSLRTRCVAEPPAFGTLSFRKASFPVPFDVAYEAGFEGKWMSDNLGKDSVASVFIPLHGVFERNGETITGAEREGKLAQLYAAHEQLLGTLSEDDRWCCRVLGGLELLPTKTSMTVMESYILRLLAGNAEKRLYDQTELQDFLVGCKTRLELRKLRVLNGKYRREMRRFREACRGYEEQLASLQAGGEGAAAPGTRSGHG
ncbi:MAG: glycosyltransferase family 2 protein, partial [Methyloceanibacter sp.]